MLNIRVVNDRQNQQFEHPGGPLEFGRGPQRDVARFMVEDGFVSRDHLRIEPAPGGRLQVTNLSQRQELRLGERITLGYNGTQVVDLPVRLHLGNTVIDVEQPGAPPSEEFDRNSYQTIARGSALIDPPTLRSLGEAPPAQVIAHWLEVVLSLQRAPALTREFHNQTARALVEMVGLDLGMVLMRKGEKWDIEGYHAASDKVQSRFSRTLVAHVVKERCTYYQDMTSAKFQTDSLRNMDAIVASPFFGLKEDEVAGVLYGARMLRAGATGGIRPLEAQVVQLLAAAVGANLARTVATRTRVQFEQFFSTKLVNELERDPQLLEGRNSEVTVLFSDLRGFTRMSEKLGAETTFRVVRDVMEKLSEQIMNHDGVIVDYAGDGILAMWNAPIAQRDHVERSCKAALAMLGEVPGLNLKWQATTGDPLALGIGIHTGTALVGNTGSLRKLKYGAMGLTVNLASRVQDQTKKAGVPLLVTEPVCLRLPNNFTSHMVGKYAMAGVAGEMPLYSVVPAASLPS